MNEIDVETLQGWLEGHRDVVVLDVRADEDREQWSIPGSRHVNAYHDLKAGRPGPLERLDLPAGVPVVTVCNVGRMAAVAAEMLQDRANVFVLRGGMQAWSLAWNTADVPVASRAGVVQVRRAGKGCLSYLVGASGVAAVIDPSLPPEVYLELAERRGWRIESILETHIHADHLSRARILAAQTGARLLLPRQNRVAYDYTPVDAGDTIAVGTVRLEAIGAPGHTLESTCYLLDDAAVFTGDTLFLNGVGRPDLGGDAREAERRATLLYGSALRLRALPEGVLALPGHTGHPPAFDGAAIAARIGEVFSGLSGWLSSEREFVTRVLARLPATPPNYLQIVALNEAGGPLPAEPTELEAGANRCAAG